MDANAYVNSNSPHVHDGGSQAAYSLARKAGERPRGLHTLINGALPKSDGLDLIQEQILTGDKEVYVSR
jgi:hypothetical protein